MGSVVGNRKQEDKISEMGDIAHQMFPDITTMSFKGFFRFAVRSALKEHQSQSWEEIAERPPEKRRRFFESVLEESRSHLKTAGLMEEEIDSLIGRLKRENEKYLKF